MVEKWLRKINLKLTTPPEKWNKSNAVNFHTFLEGVANFKFTFLDIFPPILKGFVPILQHVSWHQFFPSLMDFWGVMVMVTLFSIISYIWYWDAYNIQHNFIYLSQLKAEECSHLNHPKFNLENTGYLLYKMGTEIFKNEEEITE